MNELKPTFCPKCGAPVAETATVCHKCGGFTEYFYAKNQKSDKSKTLATLSQVFAVVVIAAFFALQYYGANTILSYGLRYYGRNYIVTVVLLVLLYAMLLALSIISLIFGVKSKNKLGYLLGIAAVTLIAMFFMMLFISLTANTASSEW